MICLFRSSHVKISHGNNEAFLCFLYVKPLEYRHMCSEEEMRVVKFPQIWSLVLTLEKNFRRTEQS